MASIDQAFHDVKLAYHEAVQLHGIDYASEHEAVGVLTEEFYEAIKALHENDNAALYLELSQIAGVCIKAMTCLAKESYAPKAN